MSEPSLQCMRCGEEGGHTSECELEIYKGRCNGAYGMLGHAQSDIFRCLDRFGGGYTPREVRLLKIIMNTNAILIGNKPLYSVEEK